MKKTGCAWYLKGYCWKLLCFARALFNTKVSVQVLEELSKRQKLWSTRLITEPAFFYTIWTKPNDFRRNRKLLSSFQVVMLCRHSVFETSCWLLNLPNNLKGKILLTPSDYLLKDLLSLYENDTFILAVLQFNTINIWARRGTLQRNRNLKKRQSYL